MAPTKKTLKKKKQSVSLKKRAQRKPVKKTAVKRKPKKVTAIPKGYHSITPYLIVNNATKAIAFYKKAFGAKEAMCMQTPNGKIAHAELKIGDSKIMLADEFPQMDAHSPKKYKGSPVSIHLYIREVDTVVKRAVKAGAKLIRPVEDQFYGDRSGGLQDPFGHKWFVSTHIENVTPAKMKKRAAKLYGGE